MLLRELFSKAEQADRKTRLRSLKDLDKAASTLADACRILLDPELSDGELRTRIYATIGHDTLEQALANVTGLVRPPDDVFYQELQRKQETVKRFLPTLLRVVKFEANPAAEPLAQALDWLRHRPDHDPPTTVIDKAWRRHVVQDDGKLDHAAFAFCALEKLHTALRRRDVFVTPSWRYADSRVGLLSGQEWSASRPLICRSLGLSADPDPR